MAYAVMLDDYAALLEAEAAKAASAT